MRGIEIQEGKADKTGFSLDRRWMLIDKNRQFLTQRQLPEMALFVPVLHQNKIEIKYHASSVTFSQEECWGQQIETCVWDDAAQTREVSLSVSEWFSDMLHQPVQLVTLVHDNARIHHSSALKTPFPVNLADAFPYLVVGTKSIDNLNEKLSEPIPANRFRANILIETEKEHEEDHWNTYRLGSATFRSVKPCGRCSVITIDQASTQRNNEPLTVLSTYRRQNNNVTFGAHTLCLEEGIVRVGDTLIPVP